MINVKRLTLVPEDERVRLQSHETKKTDAEIVGKKTHVGPAIAGPLIKEREIDCFIDEWEAWREQESATCPFVGTRWKIEILCFARRIVCCLRGVMASQWGWVTLLFDMAEGSATYPVRMRVDALGETVTIVDG